MTYFPIATTTLGSSVASYTFTSIPSTYTDLVLICNGTANAESCYAFQVGNGSVDTGSNYSSTMIYGTGSVAGSDRTSNATNGTLGRTSNTITTSYAYFQNYANTSTYKTVLSRGGIAAQGVVGVVSMWRSTAAINTIKLTIDQGGNIASGTTFTLYGIAAA